VRQTLCLYLSLLPTLFSSEVILSRLDRKWDGSTAAAAPHYYKVAIATA
jgi:hypothetical protein